MKTASAPLIALLNQLTPLAWADLFTITLQSGSKVRYTSADRPVTIGGNTFALGPVIVRGKTTTQVGVTVDKLDLKISADSTVQIAGVPLTQFIAAGGFDGARIKLERAFMANWATAPAGSVILFVGSVSDVVMGRYEADITVQSDLQLLNINVPRNLYQPSCANTLYDADCGVNRASLTVANSVTSSPPPTASTFDTTLAGATGFYDLGVLTFTGGANAGITRTVRSFVSGGLVTLVVPLPVIPAAGDHFNIYPGCDRQQSTCLGKFSNLPRFRGQPYVPVPETAT